MTSRQTLETADGFTHASSVIVVRWGVAESGIVTCAPGPNVNAPPNFPAAVHAAPDTVPVFNLPDTSATWVPEPSSNEYAATRLVWPSEVPALRCTVSSSV